ncbi:MAG: hypothetical protein WC736_00140 [Gallionella sp.]
MKKLLEVLLKTLVFWSVVVLPVWANPADYVYTPTVEYGERELDVQYGAASAPAGNSSASSVGIGYGATENWFTEVYLKRENNAGQAVSFFEWENKFQLTETGKNWVDLGLVTEMEAPLGGSAPWEVRVGALVQKSLGKFQLNGNLLFERAFGYPDESGVPYTTNLGYQWQVKYRGQRKFEFGLQGMGELGTWDNWSSQLVQNHRMGPAIFGKLSSGQAFKYNAAWLVGMTPAAPAHTFRAQLEYEF